MCLKQCNLKCNSLNSYLKFISYISYPQFRVIQEHFAQLMNLDASKFGDRLNEFLPKFYKYLLGEGNKSRKGTRESMPEKIREVLKPFEELKDDKREASMELITILLAVIIKLETSRDWLFLHFEVRVTRSVCYHL